MKGAGLYITKNKNTRPLKDLARESIFNLLKHSNKISFNFEHPEFLKSTKKNEVFGDVFISVDRVKENRKLYNVIFAKELKRVMIHGALHLIGFNDLTKKERGVMAAKENIYIELK